MNFLLWRFLLPVEMTRMGEDEVDIKKTSLKSVISNPLFGWEIFQMWIRNFKVSVYTYNYIEYTLIIECIQNI